MSASTPLLYLSNQLALSVGRASVAGCKERNEDCLGIRVPEDQLLTTKGAAAVIADGVSVAEAGREAAEICVQGFLSDYYDTAETWTVRDSGKRIVESLNSWLYQLGLGSEFKEKGYITTFSGLVIKSTNAYIFHVGDTRIWRIRGNQIEQMTRDHVAYAGFEQTQLTRAMGFDTTLEVDFRVADTETGDYWVLTSDGLHGHITGETIRDTVLGSKGDFDRACDQLIEQALSAGSEDNLSCMVIKVVNATTPTPAEVFRRLRRLPFPPVLNNGMVLDGYEILHELSSSSRSQVYLVKDAVSGNRYVMKTPSVNFEEDLAYLDRFMMEAWVGEQISSPHTTKRVDTQRRQQFLFNIYEYVEGPTLDGWMAQHRNPTIEEVLKLATDVISGLRAMHRKAMLHQDLRPANIVIHQARGAVLIDYGSSWVEGIAEISINFERDTILGTASYSAPEYRLGHKPSKRSDLFSLAVVIYEMLTGALPYGEGYERAQTPRDFAQLSYRPSYQHNPMIPVWIDGALEKALRLNTASRYDTMSEFEFDLRNPNEAFLRQSEQPFLMGRSSRFWQRVALGLFVLECATLLIWALSD